MKFAVLGSGLMGKAIAYDLLEQEDVRAVVIVDQSKENLVEAKKLINDPKLETKELNIEDEAELEVLLKDVDAAISAIHFKYNEYLTKVAIKTKTHLCDLGGSNTMVDKQLKYDSDARNAGISIIPDCGLAPGLVSVLVKWGIEKFDWTDTVKIRVGGLPQTPKGGLKYEKLFSIDGLINEYIEPSRILKGGKILQVEPMSQLEEITFPGVNHKLEAFMTSGGVSTLVSTFQKKLKNLDYKTIRYAGHCDVMKTLFELGFFEGSAKDFSKVLFDLNLPVCKEDMTLVQIIFEGEPNKRTIKILDKASHPFTSMMRMTAFPAAITAHMQATGKIVDLGVKTQELCIPVEDFISELVKRKIDITGIQVNDLSEAVV